MRSCCALPAALAMLLTLAGPRLGHAQRTAPNWKAALGPEALQARQTHGSVDVVTLGDGAERVYVFLPAEPALPPGKVPVVLFHHGWQGMDPKNYGALLDHLAREGNVVVFPVYQLNDSTSPQIVTAAAARADERALAELHHRGLEADPRRVVYFGYSMGAAISLQLAVHAAQWKLPAPEALVLAAPGDAFHVAHGADAKSIWPPLSQLWPSLPVAIVTGAEDTSIGLPSARKLLSGLCAANGGRTLPDRRSLLVLYGDIHGGVTVHAGHGAPGAPDSRYDFELTTPAALVPTHIPGRTAFEASASLNNLDFFGFWKVLDAVLDSIAAAPSSSPAYVPPPLVFGANDPGRLYMGTWPDGTPFREARSETICTE